MTLRSLIYGFWLGGMCLQALLVAVLLTKRMWERFPIFTAYSLVNFLQAVLLYAVHQQPQLYKYAYWVFESAGILLALGVVYEIFVHLFAVQPALRSLATRVFYGVVVALICLGCLVVFRESPGPGQGITSAILVVEEATRIVEVGLIVFLFVFSGVFGLHWRQSVFGIALGLGLFGAVELITVTMLSHAVSSAGLAFSLIRMGAFSSSLLVWIGYILVPEPATTGELPKREQLEQWNRAVMEFMHQ